MVALAELNADTGIDHVFPAAEGTADTEHGVFIGTVVSTDSGRIGATVIAVASGEVPLIIRVEVQRMESCQCSGTGADTIDAVAQFIDRTAEAIDSLVTLPELAAVDGIGRILADLAVGDTANLVAAHIDIALMDGDVLVIVITLDRQAAVIHGRVACRNGFSFDTVDSFEVLGQFDFQFGIITILRSNDTDIIAIGIFRNTTVNLDILVQFHRSIAGIAAVLHAIVHGSHFMSYMVVVFVYDAVHAVFAIMAVSTIDTDLAILDMDISRCVLTISTAES